MSAYNSPYDIKNSYSDLNNPFNGSMASSLVGHIVLLLLIIFGIPFVAKNPEVLYEPIPVEIISSADLESEKEPEDAAAPIQEPPIKKQAPTMVEETPPAPEEPEPVIEDAVPEPTPPPPPIETPESEVKEESEKVKPVMRPTRKPKPPPRKKVEKPKEKPQEDKMAALLKNLAETEPTPAVTKPIEAPENVTPRQGFASGQLSFNEIDKVRAQLSGCWNFPAGVRYAESLAVELNLVMNTDRTVRSVKVADTIRYNSDRSFRAAADAALRAVRNPRCSPLELPPSKYAEWKTITLNFDPQNML